MGNKQSTKKKKKKNTHNICVINEHIVRKELIKTEKAKLVKICKMNNISYKGSKTHIITRLIKLLNEYNNNIIHSSLNFITVDNRLNRTAAYPTDDTFPSNAGSAKIITIDMDYNALLNDGEYVYKKQRKANKEHKEDDIKLYEYELEQKHPDSLCVNKKHSVIESAKISSFMVLQLHRDLKLNIHSSSHDLSDTLIASLSNHIYSMQYPSHSIPSMKYCKGCVKCDDILYLNLTKPRRKLSQTFMIDIFQSDNIDTHYLNLPTRHIFNVNIKDTFKDLANQISHMFKVRIEVILFFDHIGNGILRPYGDDLCISRHVRNDKLIKCHIVKDYNVEYSLYRIANEKIRLIHCHLRHIHRTSTNNSYQFGIPFVITITSKHSIFDVFIMVYTYLYHLMGSRYLYSPTLIERKKIIISNNLNKYGEFYDWYWMNIDYDAFVKDWKWKLCDNIFSLRVLPIKYYRFEDPANNRWPDKINVDWRNEKSFNKNFSKEYIVDDNALECYIAIEWNRNAIDDRLKKAVNTIYVSKEYKKWKDEKINLKKTIKSNIVYTLYDYIENHRLNDNYRNFNSIFTENRCDIHCNLNDKLRRFDFMPYPGIVSFRLQFDEMEVVDYPIDHSLNLLKYNKNKEIRLNNSLLLNGYIRQIQNELSFSNFKYMNYNFLVSLCINYCNHYYSQTLYSLYAILYPNYQTAAINGRYNIFFKIEQQWFGFNQFQVIPVKKDDILFAGTPLVLFYQRNDDKKENKKR